MLHAAGFEALPPSRISVRASARDDAIAPADEREIQLAAGERTGEIELPFGAYDVEATSQGLGSAVKHVELDARRPSAQVTFDLQPTGLLTGAVLARDGVPLEGFPVVAQSLADGAQREARTDASGAFAFPALVAGEYRVFFGHPTAPIAGPSALSFRPPRMELEPTIVGELGTLEIRVVGEDGNPVGGALVRGTGDHGGHVALVSDDQGRCTARFLPQGTIRVFAQHATLGRGNSVLELAAGATAQVDVHLHRSER